MPSDGPFLYLETMDEGRRGQGIMVEGMGVVRNDSNDV
jgi:hypothetical protein